MTAPKVIVDLVEKFKQNIDQYRSQTYNEAQLRREFLDPFFEALGWDVGNKAGYAPQYREVIVEDSLKYEDTTKAPDYSFRIGDTRKFFVEAKRPHENIKDDPKHAYQIKRYAWNAKLPISILTDFEELAVYDCRNKPNPKDKPSTARLKLFNYTEYVERWDELENYFSKDAVWKGRFDKFASEASPKKGTTEVDDEFLKDIEKWRVALARNIALRNPSARDERLLNYAVQMTIDRIIFLRIAEDRELQPSQQLLQIATVKEMAGDPKPTEDDPKPKLVYPRLINLFKHADDKYNSGLFHFTDEKEQNSPPDSFTPNLIIDDKVLKDIIEDMYYPCPYLFKEIPVEILGQVYEQFLGSVIRVTSGGQAKVEVKPEVRKAGGVFYTPSYIVDYIVKNTVGRLLENKTPTQVSKLRVVDPACGSGSFLIGAYQYLLDWHEKYYLENDPTSYTKGKNPALVAADGGGWRLTNAERKRILVNNIYGVDIDPQAVEVTKLSLLLKLLETTSGQLSFGFERILPDLGHNIRCGNSLIGWDYFQNQIFPDENELRRINPFDWQHAFPEVFVQGGFDTVIGNPPYVRQEDLTSDKPYYKSIYKVYNGTADLYTYFIEKGVNVLREGGQFGYIVANKWLRAKYGFELREWMRQQCIEEITDFGDLKVFSTATTYPCILRISKQDPHNQPWVTTVETLDFTSLEEYVSENGAFADQTRFGQELWSLSTVAVQDLMDKITINSTPLIEYINGIMRRGIVTGFNNAFVIDDLTRKRIIDEDPRSEEIIKPFLEGKDIKRYGLEPKEKYILFTRRGIDIKLYPGVYSHLHNFKDQLVPRPKTKSSVGWKGRKPGDYEWYEIQDTIAYYQDFEKPKITWGNLAQKPKFTMDFEGFYINAPSVIIPLEDYYLLGILNSSITDFFMREVAAGRQGGFYEYKPMYVGMIPIRKIDNNNSQELETAGKISDLVKRRLELGKSNPVTPHAQETLQRQITAIEEAIDNLVFEIYGISCEEAELLTSKNTRDSTLP